MTKRRYAAVILAVMGCGVAQAAWERPSAAVAAAAEPPAADCAREEAAPCMRTWAQMSAQERAEIWPMLDDVSRSTYWHQMTRQERHAMAAHLSAADRERMRHRFTVQTKKGDTQAEERSAHRLGGLGREQRSELRRQIIEMHIELTERHIGVPSQRRAP